MTLHAQTLLGITGALSLFACVPNELGHIRAKKTGDMVAGPAPRAEFDHELEDACGDGGPTIAGDNRIVRAPYLQQVTERSARILWTVNQLARPHVAVTPAAGGEPIQTVTTVDGSAARGATDQLIARIEGLEPATIYCYEIRDESGLLYTSTGFRTAPAIGGDAPVRFTAFADLGKQTTDQFAVSDQLNTVSYDFALVPGDIAYGSGTMEAFELYYFDVYADKLDKIPFYPAVGNHDYRTDRAGPFRQVYSLPENGSNELYYSFDWGNVHIAVIDTENIDDAQVSWLDADLAATRQPWKVVMGHHPPYSSGYHGDDLEVRRKFSPIFASRGVQLALFGHEHNYERTKDLDGTTYIVTGGGGVGTRPVGTSTYTDFSEQVAHFTYVEVAGNTLTLWAVDASGQTFDTAVLRL
ncbi:MAG: metallophosphoesterase family protein [Proteobacteria bacterium]|nr:metallophosphoesterase family protein [Pseudomonadota bacterium]